ncbi:MAG: ankyrin repeat domain-containing protein [Acidobacteria bacterium]|nr:ankyrin repeat domain-containing protein [Acidobacteriota bacterium]
MSQILIGMLYVTLLTMPAAADTRLPDAAMKGDKNAVKTLLQQKVDVNAAQGDGSTALHWAAYRDDVELAQLLIAAGANLNATTRLGEMTPLFMASKNGSAAMIDLLLKAGADPNSAATTTGTTPLMLAAASGKVDAVRTLIDRGADVNASDQTLGQTPLMFAAALNRGAVITLLAERGANLKATSKVSPIPQNGANRDGGNRRGREPMLMGGNTALLFAAREGHMDAVQALIKAGTDVNQVSVSDNMPPITQAIITAHFDVAKYLLEHGASPNLQSTTSKMTPLWAAIDARYAQREWYPAPNTEQEKTSHLELITALLDKGADINARVGPRAWYRGFGNSGGPDPDGSTAFWRATAALDLEAMKLLLSRGADPTIATKRECTPLIVAAGMNHSHQGANQVPDARLPVVKFLVEELAANVNAKDEKGYTALHGAALIGRNDVIMYLISKGGDVKARADQISGSGDGGGDAKEAEPGTGDSVADMANGWSMNSPQHPETVTLLLKLGSDFANTCWASTCVNPTRPEKVTEKKKQ